MKYIKWILVLFVITSVGYLIAKEYVPTADTQSVAIIQAESSKITDGIIVYYFYGNRRCPTCRAIEKYSHEAINPYLDIDKILWMPVNVETEDNKQFVYDFQLKSSGPVIVEYENGAVKRWQPLDKVWQLVRDKEAFAKYINDEVKRFIQ